jgi:hypothetical protein
MNDTAANKEEFKSIKWTEEAEVSSKKIEIEIEIDIEIEIEINSCQKLVYMDTTLPIVLCTDASDYAIGACLFQILDDKE